MKTIKTQKSLFKALQQKGTILYATQKDYKEESDGYILNENNEVIQKVDYYCWYLSLGMMNYRKLREEQELRLTLDELGSWQKELERQRKHQQRLKAIERKKKVKEAIEYLKGFWEGDNITITSDFMNQVEIIEEYFKSLQK